MATYMKYTFSISVMFQTVLQTLLINPVQARRAAAPAQPQPSESYIFPESCALPGCENPAHAPLFFESCDKCFKKRYCSKKCKDQHWTEGNHEDECALFNGKVHQRNHNAIMGMRTAPGPNAEEVERILRGAAEERVYELNSGNTAQLWAQKHKLGSEQDFRNPPRMQILSLKYKQGTSVHDAEVLGGYRGGAAAAAQVLDMYGGIVASGTSTSSATEIDPPSLILEMSLLWDAGDSVGGPASTEVVRGKFELYPKMGLAKYYGHVQSKDPTTLFREFVFDETRERISEESIDFKTGKIGILEELRALEGAVSEQGAMFYFQGKFHHVAWEIIQRWDALAEEKMGMLNLGGRC